MKRDTKRIAATMLLAVVCSIVWPSSTAGEVGKEVNGKAPFVSSGSFAIAAVCKGGILIGADSRGTIRDSLGKELAYYDGVQKVFPIGRAALAYTGQETIQNLYFGAIVHAFARSVSDDIPLQDIIPKFLAYADSVLPEQALELVKHQLLIVAGFSEGRAMACYYNAAQTDGPKMGCGLGLVSSDRTVLDKRKKQLRSMDAQALEELIREAIPRYAEDKKAKDIGGPIYIRAITERGARWLGDAPTPTLWTYLHEFAASYWAGEVKLHILPGATRDELEATIRLGESWSKSPRHGCGGNHE
jgi:hypothetical protein